MTAPAGNRNGLHNPADLPRHLIALDETWERLLEQLRTTEGQRLSVLYEYEVAYAKAYIDAPVAQSADALRKQYAIQATAEQRHSLEYWESEVRFIRDQLRALTERTSIARSLYSGVKQATT